MKYLVQVGEGSLCAVTFWLVYEVLSSIGMICGI